MKVTSSVNAPITSAGCIQIFGVIRVCTLYFRVFLVNFNIMSNLNTHHAETILQNLKIEKAGKLLKTYITSCHSFFLY